jgi:hypothetical protein
MAYDRLYRRLMTSRLVPIFLGLSVLSPIVEYMARPAADISDYLVQFAFWAMISAFYDVSIEKFYPIGVLPRQNNRPPRLAASLSYSAPF